MKIKLVIFILSGWLMSPASAMAQDLNAGFVEGLWYSKQQFFAGDTVRVYVALRNSSAADISATIEFFDNDELIGTRTVAALSGRLIEAWTDWETAAGEHKLAARLTNLVIDEIGQSAKTKLVTDALATDNLLIDIDTDNDDIGNKDDPDDDNDGVSDLAEIENGTNPLVPDNPEETIEESPVADLDQADLPYDKEGLEQFFASGLVRDTFANLTKLINDVRSGLDKYREAGRSESETKITAPEEPGVATGSISSSQNQETVITRTGGEGGKPAGLWSKVWR